MPKKSIDNGRKVSMGVASSDIMHSKTERSHEENQERAYIAASRRSDRSLEARVQSARMASEIHKKRTGKGFKISEEIVSKEEMYEEEEDDFPRSYRLLGPHMQTPSSEMNSRVEAYLTNKVAMSRLVANSNDEWRQNEINKLFAQSFPNAGKQAQQMNQHFTNPAASHQTNQPGVMPHSPVDTTFQPVNYHQGSHMSRETRPSMSPIGHRASDASLASPGLHASTPQTPVMPTSPSDFENAPAATGMNFDGGQSAFTSELPPEAKMLMGGMDASELFSPQMFDQNWTNEQFFPDPSRGIKVEDQMDPNFQPQYYGHDGNATAQWNPHEQSGDEPMWDSFLNDI